MSDYFLLSPFGAEFALDALPASRNDAFSLVAGLAGSAPDHGTWRLVLRFDDEAYGHVELEQLVFGHYPDQGWGISGSKLPVTVPVTLATQESEESSDDLEEPYATWREELESEDEAIRHGSDRAAGSCTSAATGSTGGCRSTTTG